MPRSTIIPTAIAIPIIGVLAFKGSKLKDEVDALEAEVAELRGDASGDPSLPTGIESTATKEARQKAVAEAAALAEQEAIAAAAGSSLSSILAERDPMVRLQALLAYVDQVGVDELPNVLKALRESTPDWDPEARMAAHIMLTRWGKADPQAAFAYVASLDYKRGGGDAAVVLGALAAQDPQRAVEWLNDPTNKLAHMPWFGAVLAGTIGKEWVRQDPAAALDWAQSLPKDQRGGALAGVLQSIAATDPERASQLAGSLDSGDARRDIVGQIASAWAARDPQAALDWASSLEGDERSRAFGQALGGWAQNDPAAAAKHVDALADEADRDRALYQVASTWARQQPADAAQWLGGQDESESKAHAMADVMWNWTVADPGAASEWLSDQPVGPSRDTGIESLARATFDDDPDAAVSWAATINDDRRRQGALELGLHVWRERDPAAAEAWIEGSDLISDEEAQAFMSEANDDE